MPLSHAKLWTAIDRLARREDLKPSGLARRAGLDPTTFNPSKRFGPGDPPRPRWPSSESLTRALDATGATLAEFAALADDAPERPASAPLLGLARAGEAGFFDDSGYPVGEGWEDRTELPFPRPGLFSLRIDGDSMEPVFRPGDTVIVDAAKTDVRRGDRVVVRTTDGETLAKELGALTARQCVLVSANPAYPDRVIPRDRIAWMARILWIGQ